MIQGIGLPSYDPQLLDVLTILKRNIFSSLNCLKIGKIDSFDPSAKTATIQVLLQKIDFEGNIHDYPALVDCPVLILAGGGNSLQFPIASGDHCIVLFSDRNIDGWYATGSKQPPPDARMHSIADGIAIVGVNYIGSSLPSLSSSETRLIAADGSTKIGIESGKITIQNQAGSLLKSLNDLLTALESLTVTVSGSTGVVSAATVTALQVVGTELTALLY